MAQGNPNQPDGNGLLDSDASQFAPLITFRESNGVGNGSRVSAALGVQWPVRGGEFANRSE
jgi:hypothetical protein